MISFSYIYYCIFFYILKFIYKTSWGKILEKDCENIINSFAKIFSQKLVERSSTERKQRFNKIKFENDIYHKSRSSLAWNI